MGTILRGEQKIPTYVAPFLWSYDLTRLDLEANKKRIVLNVLNLGTREATDWLFSVYPKSEIREIVAGSLAGEWSKKSLHFWRLVLGVTSPIRTERILSRT